MKLISFIKQQSRGFTMIELVVSISIMVMMTGFLLFNYPESAIKVTLSNSVQSIALLLREAQVRGSAVDSIDSSVGGYGVYIKLSSTDTQSSVKFFADSVDVSGDISSFGLPIGNGLYEKSPIDETSSVTLLPVGYKITKFCVGQSASCHTANDDSLTISFTRPNPQPDIYLNGLKTTNFSRACIEVQSPGESDLPGHIRSIEIYNSGMISTKISPCS